MWDRELEPDEVETVLTWNHLDAYGNLVYGFTFAFVVGEIILPHCSMHFTDSIQLQGRSTQTPIYHNMNINIVHSLDLYGKILHLGNGQMINLKKDSFYTKIHNLIEPHEKINSFIEVNNILYLAIQNKVILYNMTNMDKKVN